MVSMSSEDDKTKTSKRRGRAGLCSVSLCFRGRISKKNFQGTKYLSFLDLTVLEDVERIRISRINVIVLLMISIEHW